MASFGRVPWSCSTQPARACPCRHWRGGFALGIAATLAANVAHGLGHGPIGAAVAAWPAVALIGSYELLMMTIRGAQLPAREVSPETEKAPAGVPDALQVQAAGEFAADVASGHMPSIRVIRTRLHVGQPRAQLVRAYLATLAAG